MADLDTDMGTYAATILGLRITWALTIVLVLFVSLRIAVRLLVVRKFGPDDHAFLWAGVSSLGHMCLGQNEVTRLTKGGW